MKTEQVLEEYNQFQENSLNHRFFTHDTIVQLIQKLPKEFTVKTLGNSVNGKPIQSIKWGKGSIKIMLWSQMHGDEATGTMAIFDFFNFLQQNQIISSHLSQNCELLFIPMVNPDGATAFTRRNAQQIDINRDYLQTISPEAKILKQCRDEFNPHFGFNLHDQSTLWSVENSRMPACLSFLAPAYNQELSINDNRKDAMKVIIVIFQCLNLLLPEQIGLFDDEFEPRAFGDNFQKAGTATILIEAGGFQDDYEKQEIRKYYFLSILKGIQSIANKTYVQHDLKTYFDIPKNTKQIFHILIHHVNHNNISVSIGINYKEDSNGKIYYIEDLGDLSTYGAYQIYNANDLELKGEITLEKPADFELYKENKIFLAFSNGKLQQKH